MRLVQRSTAMTGHPDRLVRASDVALALGVDVSTVYRWERAGIITAATRTAGGQARYHLDDVRREVANHIRRQEDPRMPSATPEAQPVVAAIVTSARGVLAGQRRDGKPPWTFIAGEVEPGESIADAAVREVKEETGLRVQAADFEIGRRVHPKTGRTMIYLPCEPIAGLDVFVGDAEELADVRWLTLDKVDELFPGMFEPVRDHLGRALGRR